MDCKHSDHKVLARCRLQDNAVPIGRMLKETGILGGVPRRQPVVVLTGEQQHRLPRSLC